MNIMTRQTFRGRHRRVAAGQRLGGASPCPRARPFVPAWSPRGRPSDVTAEVPLSAFPLRSAE